MLKNIHKHFLFAMLLLLAFVSGQLIVYFHEHEMNTCCGQISVSHHSKSGYHAINSESQTCLLCDAGTHQKLWICSCYNAAIYFRIIGLAGLVSLHTPFLFIKQSRSRGPPHGLDSLLVPDICFRINLS